MSATSTRSSTRVRTGARSTVYVAAEINTTLLKITSNYGLSKGCLVDTPDLVPKGLMVWLAARQLRSVIVEILDDKGRLVRKFQMDIDYGVSDDEEEVFRSQVRSLEEFLKTDRPGKVGSYRILCPMNTEKYIPVPGWSWSTLADDKHLHRQDLSADSIATNDLRVGFAVYTGTSSQSGAMS